MGTKYSSTSEGFPRGGYDETLTRRPLTWHKDAKPVWLLTSPRTRDRFSRRGNVRLPFEPDWPNAAGSSSCWPMVPRFPTFPARWTSAVALSTNGPSGFANTASLGCTIKPAVAGNLFFTPDVAMHLVTMASERPDHLGRSLSQWDCAELARALVDEGIVPAISAETVRRILDSHKLKPWRNHMWLNPQKPRDETFYACVAALI